jgi:ABC-type polysaccharide transport system permease subunit
MEDEAVERVKLIDHPLNRRPAIFWHLPFAVAGIFAGVVVFQDGSLLLGVMMGLWVWLTVLESGYLTTSPNRVATSLWVTAWVNLAFLIFFLIVLI